jgi:hypothetical protein
MLIYDVVYYRKSGQRSADCDTGLPWKAAVQSAVARGYYAQITCTNGEAKVYRVAPDGTEIARFPWEGEED